MAEGLPVIKGVRYVLAHVPGLVRDGSKPSREPPRDPALAARLQAHLRPFAEAAAHLWRGARLRRRSGDPLVHLVETCVSTEGYCCRWVDKPCRAGHIWGDGWRRALPAPRAAPAGTTGGTARSTPPVAVPAAPGHRTVTSPGPVSSRSPSPGPSPAGGRATRRR
jgi:hypothetical protein